MKIKFKAALFALLVSGLLLSNAAKADMLYNVSDLGTLGGNTSSASGINDSGQVVGSSTLADGSTHSFISTNGVMTDLGTLGGNDSYASGINASGQVVGSSTLADGSTHSFISTNGVMTDLGTGSYAFDINDSGQVVGRLPIADGSQHAFINTNGVMMDLNTLMASTVSGLLLTNAQGINNSGQIVASGTMNGLTHAFLLTPTAVPLPAAVWLFGSGLIGLATFTHRKNKSTILITA